MKLDLTEIAGNLGKRIKYEFDEPPIKDIESGLNCVENIKGEATFSNTSSTIDVRGSFHTRVEIECARCLRSYQLDVDIPIEEELLIAGHVPIDVDEEPEEEQLPEEEMEPIFEDNIFNLTELIRQSILVTIPIKPLCSDICKGLCLSCGKNLNDGPCDCAISDEATPFAALASLLKEEDKESES